jgi:hypothetical protein
MLSMAQPKKPKRERAGENLNVWVRKGLLRVFRDYLGTVRPRTTKTAVVEEALEQYLASKGFRENGAG